MVAEVQTLKPPLLAQENDHHAASPVQALQATSLSTSVGDPDPHVFGPPGSRSIRQRSGSESFPFLIKMLSELK
jgi:hypothetical protein